MNKNILRKIVELNNELYSKFGPQGWWPVTKINGQPPVYHPGKEGKILNNDEKFEIIVGALLTQNTAWKNVEKALVNLTSKNKLKLEIIARARGKWLEEAVKPSGYYRQKSIKLKKTANEIISAGGIDALSELNTSEFRELLLSWYGFGPETADSVLCYAFNRPVFVVDAYTKRLFLERRINLSKYDDIQNAVHEALPKSDALYGDFHARIVRYYKSRE